jgi:hypothetical protein
MLPPQGWLPAILNQNADPVRSPLPGPFGGTYSEFGPVVLEVPNGSNFIARMDAIVELVTGLAEGSNAGFVLGMYVENVHSIVLVDTLELFEVACGETDVQQVTITDDEAPTVPAWSCET